MNVFQKTVDRNAKMIGIGFTRATCGAKNVVMALRKMREVARLHDQWLRAVGENAMRGVR